MKIFLAGCEQWYFAELPILAGHNNLLFSYYHLSRCPEAERNRFFEVMATGGLELICDSGLFTLMFGMGKGGSYDLTFMREYTKKYIETANRYQINNLTIVESDVHKLLGMDAVFELRKQFEDCGMNVIYVWHREEGIEGLYRMAERYKYIAISVPELRILCKEKIRYQNAVKDLELKILKNTTRVPKIHLLGNTVMETMKTNASYSCDSTSWLSGGRYGRFMDYKNGRIKAAPLTGEIYLRAKASLEQCHTAAWDWINDKWAHKGQTRMNYMISMYLSAKSFKLYQDYLNRNYTCLEEVSNENQHQLAGSSNRPDQSKSMEPQPPN